MSGARSLILETLSGTIVRLTMVFSLFMLFAGHNAPGGGFVGGLVASVGLVISFVARGPVVLRRLGPLSPEIILGLGIALSALTGIGGWFWGENFLESAKTSFHLPVVGQISVTSALPFDIGVYLVVFGLAASVVSSLGRVEGAPEP